MKISLQIYPLRLEDYPENMLGQAFLGTGLFLLQHSGNVTDEVIKQHIEGQDCVSDDNFRVDGEADHASFSYTTIEATGFQPVEHSLNNR